MAETFAIRLREHNKASKWVEIREPTQGENLTDKGRYTRDDKLLPRLLEQELGVLNDFRNSRAG